MEEKGEALAGLVQNLMDAGCGGEMVEQYLECCGCGDVMGKERLLQKHRRGLLEELHGYQKKIDCLDYLICRERRRREKRTGDQENHRKGEAPI